MPVVGAFKRVKRCLLGGDAGETQGKERLKEINLGRWTKGLARILEKKKLWEYIGGDKEGGGKRSAYRREP